MAHGLGHAAVELLDRSRRLLQVARGVLGAPRQVVVAGRDLARGALHLVGAGADLGDDVAQPRLHRGERAQHVADFVVAVAADDEIEPAGRDAGGGLGGAPHLIGDAPLDHPRQADRAQRAGQADGEQRAGRGAQAPRRGFALRRGIRIDACDRVGQCFRQPGLGLVGCLQRGHAGVEVDTGHVDGAVDGLDVLVHQLQRLGGEARERRGRRRRRRAAASARP